MMLRESCRIFVILGAMAYGALAAVPALADPQDSARAHPRDLPPEHAASNQSVSLPEESSAPASSEADDVTVAGPAATVDGEGQNPTNVFRRTGNSRPEGGKTISREVLRLQADEAVPWYRSGAGALAIVLGLVVAAAWALRRWVPSARSNDGSVLRVVSRAPLTQKHSLALVYVGRRFVVVGVTGDRVNVLCEIRDADEVAELVRRVSVSDPKAAGEFDHALLREAAEFSDTVDADETRTDSGPAPGGAGREPMRDLLQKLRLLKIGETAGA